MRLIDADAIAPKLEGKFNQDMVRYAPTINAVPVVRCRECRHYVEGQTVSACRHEKGMVEVTPDDFCSCGERKEDEPDD